MRDEQSVAGAVVTAVAAAEGVPVQEIQESLYDAVDPDALGRLFRGSPGQVIFEYHDYEVTIDHEGIVTVLPLDMK